MEEYDGKEQASYWVYHGQSPYGRGEDCEVRKTQEGQYGAWRARGEEMDMCLEMWIGARLHRILLCVSRILVSLS